MTKIAAHVQAFLQEYLPRQRGASPHTCDTYAYSYQLLFQFVAARHRIQPSQITLEQLDTQMITDFLADLESNRNCVASTRNVRLAAIKSFFRFLQYRLPAFMEQIRQILALPAKKSDSTIIVHLDEKETKVLLRMPNIEERMGIRDYAMIQLTLTAGLRVSELLGLRVEDLILQPQASIRIKGKGRKERVLPLWKETTLCLKKWLAVRGDHDEPELFVNGKGQGMTRWGFSYILKKYVKQASEFCPSLKKKKVSPHVLRHSCAMVVYRATHDIRKVAIWLGHNSIQTTEIYLRADQADKLDAIQAITPPKQRRGKFRAPDKLLSFLKTQTLCGANSSEAYTAKPVY